MRLKFCDEGSIPDQAIITPAKLADKNKLNDLIVEEEDSLNIFDRGYADYKIFDEYCQKSIRFITRLKRNAIIEVVKENPLKSLSSIKKDQIVYLGNSNSKTKMQHPLRLVETEDTEGNSIIILTSFP